MVPAAKILLVDAESLFSAELGRELAKCDLALFVAGGEQEVMARLEADADVAVVVLSTDTPGWCEIETMKRIKERRPLVEVIILTSQAEVEAAVQAVKSGACDYIQKNVEAASLVEKIGDAALRKQKRDRQVLELYMQPYVTRKEREERLAGILAGGSDKER